MDEIMTTSKPQGLCDRCRMTCDRVYLVGDGRYLCMNCCDIEKYDLAEIEDPIRVEYLLKEVVRPEISPTEERGAMEALKVWYNYRRKQKGRASYASKHEILGSISEEFAELQEAIHTGDFNEIAHELKDVAIAAAFGFVCWKSGKAGS
jgi:hypothetical protein